VTRAIPRLHVITDDEILKRSGWVRTACEVLDAGGASVALHVRGPALSGRMIYETTESLIGAAAGAGALLFVNDRVDVAMTLPVAGVHLRERSLPVREARRLLGDGACIGASVHGSERARVAQDEGANYLVVGTVFATPSHPDRPGEGVELLERVGRASELPLVAIGGISPERVHSVRRAGAHGVAVRGGVWDAADPAHAVTTYLSALGV
jgi:thiamine-phosphate diphosphorylase